MNINHHYETASKAIDELFKQGYTIDFNLETSDPATGINLNWSDFKITEIYRYEGDSDPADETIIYAIASPNGTKGILVAGYGIYHNEHVNIILTGINNYRSILS